MRSTFCWICEHKVERVVRGPAAGVPAAPDQPAAPTPPLTSPRNAGGGHPAGGDPPGSVSAGDQRDRELRPGRPGCEQRSHPPEWGQFPLARGTPLRLNPPRGSGRGRALSRRVGPPGARGRTDACDLPPNWGDTSPGVDPPPDVRRPRRSFAGALGRPRSRAGARMADGFAAAEPTPASSGAGASTAGRTPGRGGRSRRALG
jgi:hypothetical protein